MTKKYWVSELKDVEIKSIVWLMGERSDEFTSEDVEAFLSSSLDDVEDTLASLGLYFHKESQIIKDEEDSDAVIIAIEDGESLETSEFDISDSNEREEAISYFEASYKPVIYLTHDVEGLGLDQIENMNVIDTDVKTLIDAVDLIKDFSAWNHEALEKVITVMNMTDQLGEIVKEVYEWDELQARAFLLGFEITSFHLELTEFMNDITTRNFISHSLTDGETSYNFYGKHILAKKYGITPNDELYNFIDIEELGAYEIHDATSDIAHSIETPDGELFIYGTSL